MTCTLGGEKREPRDAKWQQQQKKNEQRYMKAMEFKE